jgi:hypothetical protein
MFKFLKKTEDKILAEKKQILAQVKASVVGLSEYILSKSLELDDNTIKAFEALHEAIEAEEKKLVKPAPVATETAAPAATDAATPTA